MNKPVNNKPVKKTQLRRQRIALLVLPTLLFGAVGTFHALTKVDVWTVNQSLILRDEVSGEVNRLGRFESTDAMQTAEETVLEVARHPAVVGLAAIGPPVETSEQVDGEPKARLKSLSCWLAQLTGVNTHGSGDWPTPRIVEDTIKFIQVSAPEGAQFGRTEMIYLSVADKDQERGRRLIVGLCNGLQEHSSIFETNDIPASSRS